MATPPAIPAGDGRPSRTRAIVAWIGLFALISAVIAMLLTWSQEPEEPAVVETSPPLTVAEAGETCLRLSENSREYLSSEATQRRQELRRTSCDMAFAAEPDNLQFKVAVARAMPHAQRAEKLALLREAAAQGSAEANYEIYESHKSWDRGDPDKAPMVPRAEADRALRKAAELGHPFSTQMLAILLDRGTTVKRDPVAARYWAERALDNPVKDASRGDLQVFLGRLLAASDKPEERARGLEILERRSVPGYYQYGARRELARAIRKDDPVRARKLLEEARSPDPGGATPLLAEMLIAGEGGPADPQRALKLLKAPSGHRRREGRARASLSRRQTGAARCPGSGAPDRHGGRMEPRRTPAGLAVARGQPGGAGHASQVDALLRARGRGARRTRGDDRADRAETVRQMPSSRTGREPVN